MKKTKIITTIGPASASGETVKKMAEKGMNVARINFSHGTHESNGKLIDYVKKVRKEMKMPLGIMGDLQGPRIRVSIEKDLEIKTDEKIILSDLSLPESFQFSILNFQSVSNDKISNFKNIVKFDKKGIVESLEVGNNILIEDGTKKLEVVEKSEGCILAQVKNGGTIKNNKGVNIPDSELNIPVVTEKDEKDLKFLLEQDADFIALSFVGKAQDILNLREKIKEILDRKKNLPQIVAKIERKEAIKNIDEIIKASDVVMVARGDLGIEMEESKVIIYQKEIIKKCLRANKPVIVATQMLNSMIESPLPTRAEVSDVTNAVVDHADAVMLSGETANGKYPVEAVEVMSRIIKDTEESPFDDVFSSPAEREELSEYVSVINSAYEMARNSEARAIMMFTFSGITARMMSWHRPQNKLLLVATSQEKTFHQLSIIWGIRAYLIGEEVQDDFVDILCQKAVEEKRLEKNDSLVVIMGKLPGGQKMRLVGIRKVSDKL